MSGTTIPSAPAAASSAVGAADPITTEIIRHGLDAAADGMRVALQRTAFSPIIYEAMDFACALYDREVRLLAQARALPMFIGTLSFCIESAVEQIGGEQNLEPGDVIFSTYGYDIGSHQQDATVVIPSFFEGELIGYAAIKAHHMDIGAKEIYCTDTRDVFQEGAIFPSVKIYRAGVKQEEMYRTIIANSRMPEALAGDLAAQVSAAHIGLAALDQILQRYGLETFRISVERMLDHGDALLKNLIESLPDGRYVASGSMDNNGITTEPVPIEVAVEISGGDVVVDFTNAPPEQPGPINCPLATTVSASRVAIMSISGATESANEGFFRRVKVRTKPGTLFDPNPPAPIYMYFWPAMQAVDLIHKALASAMPDRVPAGNGGDICNVNWWGVDEDGKFWGAGNAHSVGQGADAAGDGRAPLVHITAGVRNTPAEVFEAKRPLLLEKFELGTDSGGAGRHRGGPGLDVHYRVLRDLEITAPIDRTQLLPWGLEGGGPARANRFAVRFPDGTVTEYQKVTGLKVPAGSVVEVHTGGGGGFGPASEREVEAVLHDVREGYISEEAARADYPHAFEPAA
jgi:N-methylhydantoinase B